MCKRKSGDNGQDQTTVRSAAHSQMLRYNSDFFVCVTCRDIAGAIKELLDTVNTIFRKYQYQNRRVSRRIKSEYIVHKRTHILNKKDGV